MRIEDPNDRTDEAAAPSPWSRDGSSFWNKWADGESPDRSDRQVSSPGEPPAQDQFTRFPPPDPATVVTLQRPDAGSPEVPHSGTARWNKWLPFVAVFALGIACGVAVSFAAKQSDPTASSVDTQNTDQAGSAIDLSVDTISAAPYDSGATTSASTGEAADRPPLPDGAQLLGDLLPEAAYVGDYGVLDPALLPEIQGVAPTTDSNLDRWLADVPYENSNTHWAVGADGNATGVVPILTWRAPVTPPPAWLLEKASNADRLNVLSDDQLTISRRTADGTWVEVTVDVDVEGDVEGEVAEWIDGLSSLATATDVTAPPGFWEGTQFRSGIVLSYPVYAENTTITVLTVEMAKDLDDSETQLFLSIYGRLGPPVTDFTGPGTLYSFDPPDAASLRDQGSALQHAWEVNPHLFVLLGSDPAPSSPDGAKIAHSLTLSSELFGRVSPVEAPPPTSVYSSLQAAFDGGTVPDDDTPVVAVRYGELDSIRFVYVERLEGAESCAIFTIGLDPPSCHFFSYAPVGKSCVYRSDVIPGVGYRLTVLADTDLADEVSITAPGLVQSDIQSVNGTTGPHHWTAMTVLVEKEPFAVTGRDGICPNLS